MINILLVLSMLGVAVARWRIIRLDTTPLPPGLNRDQALARDLHVVLVFLTLALALHGLRLLDPAPWWL